MANNPYVNKVQKADGTVIIDISDTTAVAADVAQGKYFYTANGTKTQGTASGGGSSDVQVACISEGMHLGETALAFFTGEELIEPTSFFIYALNDITPSSTSKVATVVYDGTNLFGQLITNTSNAQVSYSTDFSLDIGNIYNNAITVTVNSEVAVFDSNVTYAMIYTYGGTVGNVHTADVQVGSGATSITFTGLDDEPLYWSCAFKSNFSTSSGYQRVIAVVNGGDGEEGLEMDSGAHFSDAHWTSSYSNGSLTITSNGTNQGGYFHQPGYYQLTFAISGEAPEIETEPLSVTENGTYTAPRGKAYTPVTVNVSGGGSLTVKTATVTHTSTSQTLSFSSLSGQPKYWFVRPTSQISSSGSTTYYYLTGLFFDGTNIKGNSFRIGSTRRIYDVTSGITQSYSNNTLTITGGSSTGASPGQFYGASNFGYELVYVY